MALAGYDYWEERSHLSVSRLTGDIDVTAQISENQIASIAEQGYATIIDLRPDGEEPGQATSKAIDAEARKYHLAFYYPG